MSNAPVVSLNDELLAELKTAAESATPGPWSSSGAIPERSFCAQVWNADGSAMLYHDEVSDQATADVRFVSLANPATILALLAEREELKRDAERYRWLRDDRGYFPEEEGLRGGSDLDAAIDAAMQS